MQDKPTSVTNPRDTEGTSKQAGEVRVRWAWTKALVWTDRMLKALETGVKGGKWFSLMDKVYRTTNLYTSYFRVQDKGGAPGADRVTVEAFGKRLNENLNKLSQQLEDGSYRPHDVLRTWIPKPGTKEKRPLGIPTVRDRVVQAALLHVIEPIFERDFSEQSYGFRPGRSCKDALRRVDNLLKDGYRYVVDADLKSYFDTIPHDRLLQRIQEKISDGRVLDLIRRMLEQGIMEGLKQWTPTEGSPQGSVISPLFSNIYLDPLDHRMAELGFEMIRYADDFVILCRTREEADAAMEEVQRWTARAGLTLHPTKTCIVDAVEEGFDFLGYTFCGGEKRPRKKSLKKFKDTIRAKTKRSNGHSLKTTINMINPVLRGWFEYFKHSHRWTFDSNDSWVRHRLRSILRKRDGRRGRGRGLDHNRYQNAYFAKRGLFSMEQAHIDVLQPSSR